MFAYNLDRVCVCDLVYVYVCNDLPFSLESMCERVAESSNNRVQATTVLSLSRGAWTCRRLIFIHKQCHRMGIHVRCGPGTKRVNVRF